MKTRLFLLSLLLSASFASLQAFPMMEGEERKPADQNKQRNARNDIDPTNEHNQNPTLQSLANSSAAQNALTTSMGSSSSVTSAKKIFEDLSITEQAARMKNSLFNARQLIYKAHQANDLSAEAWKTAPAKIKLVKKWSQSIITPPPLSAIDRWLGQSQKTYTDDEVNAAKLVHIQALALEAALPARQASAAAIKAIKLTQQSATGATIPENSTAPTDPHTDALQKIETSSNAWEQGRTNFGNRASKNLSDSLQKELSIQMRAIRLINAREAALAEVKKSDALNKSVIGLWKHWQNLPDLYHNFPKDDSLNSTVEAIQQGTQEVHPIAQALANEFYHLSHQQEVSQTELKVLQAQRNVEAALANYKRDGIVSKKAVTEAIEELKKCNDRECVMIMDTGPQFQEEWEALSKRLNYFIAFYEAELASLEFHHALVNHEKAKQNNNNTADTMDAIEKGNVALKRWKAAIAAKRATLLNENVDNELISNNNNNDLEAVRSSSSSSSSSSSQNSGTALTPEEQEAAKARLAEFQQEYDAIQVAVDALQSNHYQWHFISQK